MVGVPVFPSYWSSRASTSCTNECQQWTITQKMADQDRSDFYVVFTMILCALKLPKVLISSLPELIWISNKNLVLSEAI